MKKALQSISAILLMAAMIFGFASCSNDDDDDDDKTSTVASADTNDGGESGSGSSSSSSSSSATPLGTYKATEVSVTATSVETVEDEETTVKTVMKFVYTASQAALTVTVDGETAASIIYGTATESEDGTITYSSPTGTIGDEELTTENLSGLDLEETISDEGMLSMTVTLSSDGTATVTSVDDDDEDGTYTTSTESGTYTVDTSAKTVTLVPSESDDDDTWTATYSSDAKTLTCTETEEEKDDEGKVTGSTVFTITFTKQ